MKEHQAGPQSYTLTNRDGGQQLKHTRLATGGEREEEKRQAEQKRQHQNCSLVLVRPFSLFTVVPIIVPFLGCVRLSSHVPRLLLFSFFSMWILIFAGARLTQEDTLKVFIYQK